MAPPSNPLSLSDVPVTRPVGGIRRLLTGGLRALLLRPPLPGTISTAAGHLILLVLLVTGIGIGGEYWLYGTHVLVFNWSTLREAWFDLPILLLGGAWLVQSRPNALTRPTPPLHFAAVMISTSVWIVAVAWLLVTGMAYGWIPAGDDEANLDWIYFGAPFWAWVVAVATIRRMHRFSPIPALRRLVLLLVMALITAWYLLVPSEPYWQMPPGEEPELYARQSVA